MFKRDFKDVFENPEQFRRADALADVYLGEHPDATVSDAFVYAGNEVRKMFGVTDPGSPTDTSNERTPPTSEVVVADEIRGREEKKRESAHFIPSATSRRP